MTLMELHQRERHSLQLSATLQSVCLHGIVAAQLRSVTTSSALRQCLPHQADSQLLPLSSNVMP